MQIPDIRTQFLLDPSVVFLNHGSFGATPRPVFECYQRWQLELERQPVEFFSRRAVDLLQSAREVLACYLGTQSGNLAFVTNATLGLNIIARSLELGPGDEVLTSDHEYGSMDVMWRHLARKRGFAYINQPVPLPLVSVEDFVESFWRAVTPHTRVIFLSQITSPTAVIFPVKELCRRARRAGILSIIDGAHAPGQIALNLDDLGADFYSGNLHKWLCAPKGAAFVYARPEIQGLVEPLILTAAWEQEQPAGEHFARVLEYNGTRDLAAFLAVPEAIRFQQEHGWEDVRRECHALSEIALGKFVELSGQPAYYPGDGWYAQMVAAPLPQDVDVTALKHYLFAEHQVEIPVIEWNGLKHLRCSFQAYNQPEDLEALVAGVKTYLNKITRHRINESC